MPTYQLEHALTGRTYKVRFDSDPTPEDIDHILAQFTEQDGFDPPTLAEMARERTKLTTLQRQAAIFPSLATAADTFMEALPVLGSVKQFVAGSTDDPMRAGPSEIRRRLTASQERLANLQRGGRRFLESERASREDTGQGRFSSAFSAIPQEVLKAPGTAVKGFGDVAGAIVPSLQGNVVSQFGEAMNETAREWLPTNPAYQGEIQQKAAQAVGQGAASLAEAYIGGGAARAVGAGEKAITTAATLAPRVTGFLKGASQGEDIAKANQVTDPFARAALVLGTGGIESATEAIGGVGGKEGTQALLGRGIRPRLNAAGEVIASEAGEEMGAGLAQPLLERATITPDPARPGYSLGGQKLAPIPTSIDDAQAWLRSAQEQGFYGAIGAAVPGAIAGMRSQTPDFAGVTEAPVHPATAPTTDAGSTPAAGTPSPTPSVSPSAPRQSLADIAAGAGRSPSPPLPVSASPRLPLSPGTYTGPDAHQRITATLATTAQDPDAPQGLRELDAELAQHDYTGITLEVVDDPNATVEAQGQRLPFSGYASHGATPGTGTMGVNLGMQGRGEASPTDTVRHEALHFRLKREIERPSTPASQQALTGLTGLKDALAADPEAAQEFDYETGDLHEWISGIASSKPLRAKLASMPASPAAQARGIRSMWDQFVAWIKQLVTGRPATQRTALDDALAHILTMAKATRQQGTKAPSKPMLLPGTKSPAPVSQSGDLSRQQSSSSSLDHASTGPLPDSRLRGAETASGGPVIATPDVAALNRAWQEINAANSSRAAAVRARADATNRIQALQYEQAAIRSRTGQTAPISTGGHVLTPEESITRINVVDSDGMRIVMNPSEFIARYYQPPPLPESVRMVQMDNGKFAVFQGERRVSPKADTERGAMIAFWGRMARTAPQERIPISTKYAVYTKRPANASTRWRTSLEGAFTSRSEAEAFIANRNGLEIAEEPFVYYDDRLGLLPFRADRQQPGYQREGLSPLNRPGKQWAGGDDFSYALKDMLESMKTDADAAGVNLESFGLYTHGSAQIEPRMVGRIAAHSFDEPIGDPHAHGRLLEQNRFTRIPQDIATAEQARDAADQDIASAEQARAEALEQTTPAIMATLRASIPTGSDIPSVVAALAQDIPSAAPLIQTWRTVRLLREATRPASLRDLEDLRAQRQTAIDAGMSPDVLPQENLDRWDDELSSSKASAILTAEEQTARRESELARARRSDALMQQWFPSSTQHQRPADASWWADMFESRFNPSAKLAAFWKAIAAHDEAFQFGRTTSTDAADIAAAVSTPRSKVTARDDGDSITFTTPHGEMTVHDADTSTPYIRSTGLNSQGKEQGGGSQAYQAALDWIHNNGKTITDDVGLTDINAIRRTSNFFSSALRWGTTKHLKPHAKQGVRGWKKGAHMANIGALARREMANVFSSVAQTADWTYDFDHGTFHDTDGREITPSEIKAAAVASNPTQSGVGFSTLERAVLTNAALQELERLGEGANVSAGAELAGRGSHLSSSRVGTLYLPPANASPARYASTPAQTRAADPRAGLRADPQVRISAIRRTVERIAAAHGAEVRWHRRDDPQAKVAHEGKGVILSLSGSFPEVLNTLSPEARRGNLTKLQVKLALENGYRAAGQASPKPRTPATVAKDVMASLVQGYRREEGFAEETRRGFAAALSTLRRKPYAAGDTEVFLKEINQVIRDPKPFLDHLLRQLMELRATGRITEQDDGTFAGNPEWEARTLEQFNRFLVQAAAGTHGDTMQSIIMQSIPALDDSMIATEEGERNLASLPTAPAPSPTLPSREDYLRDWIAREKQILRDQLRDIEARYRAERPNLAASIILRAMSQRFVDRSPENTRFISLRKTRRLHAAKLAQARDELRTLTDPAYAAKVAPHRTPEARAKAAADSWAHVRRTVGYAFGWHTRYLFDPITGQILEIPSAGVIADQIGAIAAEVKDIATFTTRLAQRFGDWITPHARALWNAVKEATRAALMRALEKIGAIKFAVPYQEDAASLGASVPPASVPSAHAIAQGVKFTGQPTPPPFDGAQLVGTCVSEQQINTAFGDMDTFERLVQERGDEFTEGDTTVTYNPRTHEHFFWKHTDPASAPQLLPPSVRYPGRGPFKVENLVAQAQITGSPLPADFREILGRSNEEKAALKNSAARLARDLDAEMRRQVKLTSATRTQLESTVNNALDDPAVMTALAASNPSLHARVLPMRNMLDTLSTTVASWTSQTMGDTILGNLGSWLRRSYMAFDPSSGWSYDALVDAAAKGKAVLGQTPAAVILRNARAFLQAQNPSATPDQITIQMKLLTDRQTWLNVLSGNKDAKVTKDVTSLIRRKEIPAPLRALMGEVRDPLARFGQSASFQAQFIARHEMQQRMRDTGLALGIFSPVQTPDHLVQVGGVDGADANPVWSGFGADLWTTPQMLAALRNAKGVNTGTTLRDRILDTIAFLGGKSKEARVALSPDFYSTNIIGAVLALAGSGDLTLSQQSLRSMGKAMQTLWMARLDKTAVTPAAKQATIDAARDLVSRLESAGVLSSGVNMDELLASLTSPTAEALTNTKTKDRVAGAAQGALTLQGLGHTIAGNPGRLAGAAVGAALGGWAGMKNISKPHRALMEALVSTPDLFAKLTAYLNNRDAYLRSGLSAEDAHAKAVEVTRNTMPDYSKVPAFLRELSRLGIIGSFIAFRAESYRNLYWNARYAAQELRSGNPALRLRGAQRLMGIALSQSLAAGKIAGIFGLLGYLSDADDEEDKAYRRALARKWDANAQLVYDKLDANGASYFSADYLVPQASAMQIIRAAVEGRSFAESMTAVASTIKEQAIGGNLVLQPLIEAYTNSKFEGNFPVSTKQGWEGAFDRALHVLETMEPGYASKAKKLVRAATGMGLGRAEYTFTDEALRTLGLRMNNVKHEPQIRSKLSEFNALLAATRTSANAAWSNFGGRTLAPAGAKMRQDALDAANAERAQIKADFDAWLNDLSTLRISPQKVKSIGSLPSFAPLRVTKDGVTAANLR